MERSRENGYCCGGGGGGMWLDGFTANHTTERLSERRVREAAQTGATALAVCCPYEVSRFEDGAKSTGNESCGCQTSSNCSTRPWASLPRVPELRVIDFGRVSALRSQTLWHALAYGVSAGGPPTLSFMRPSRPYVGLGYHRRLEEADIDACREAGLPVFRRMVGGGVVYLDEHQQFFQICVPVPRCPRGRGSRRCAGCSSPAVAAFRAAGVPAELDDDLEIVVGEAKICGHGAAQIEDAVVVVGNLIERFDHAAAARVLALPDEVRAEVVRLMERFVTATPADSAAFRGRGRSPPTARPWASNRCRAGCRTWERERLHEIDGRFLSPAWLRGPTSGPKPGVLSQVKVRAGVFVVCAEHERSRAVATRGRREDRAGDGLRPGVERRRRRWWPEKLAGVAMADVGARAGGVRGARAGGWRRRSPRLRLAADRVRRGRTGA